jgi:glycosyltransferase involved in cell wall biosynthesis
MDDGKQSLLISVVVPCLGHARELERCLAGLERQAPHVPFEVIVVDSAADPAVASAASSFRFVTLVRSSRKLLPGEARNAGVERAIGNYLAFTDADCVPEPGWLDAASHAFEAGARMVGGPVLDAEPSNVIAAADNFMQFVDFLPYRPEGPADHFPGCNIAVDRSTFHQLGGFPSDVPVSEDTIFSGTAAARWPREVRFRPEMRVRHRGRRTLGAFRQHQEVFGYYRGLLGLRQRRIYQRLGRSAALATLITYKRVGYFTWRLRWKPRELLRFAVLLPIVLIGLASYSRGFRNGCRAAARP